MTAKKKIAGPLRDQRSVLLNGLARTVISRVNTGSTTGRNRRLDVGTKMLVQTILDQSSFSLDRVCHDLEALRITSGEVIDYCVPVAAQELGVGWQNDELSFARVSTASARLFGLCKHVSQDWSRVRDDPSAPAVLVCTLGEDNHILGPTVLVEKLRRCGCIVDTALNSTASDLLHRLRAGQHHALMVTVSSYHTLDLASEAIKIVRQGRGIDVPIVLGGAILDYEDELEERTGADLVTKDVDTALRVVKLRQSELRAAQ